MPVLLICHIPELNGVIGIKVGLLGCLRTKKPIAKYERPIRTLWPELVHHDVVGMHTEKHVRENRIVKDPMMIFRRDVTYRKGASVPAQCETVTLGDRHESTKKRTFAQIVFR